MKSMEKSSLGCPPRPFSIVEGVKGGADVPPDARMDPG
jgi:hypothetical protein